MGDVPAEEEKFYKDNFFSVETLDNCFDLDFVLSYSLFYDAVEQIVVVVYKTLFQK